MKSFFKLLIGESSLFSLFGLPLNSSNSSSNFDYHVHPIIKNEDVTIDWSFDISNCRLFTLTIRVFSDKTEAKKIYEVPKQYDFRGQNNRVYQTSTIPYYVNKNDNIYFQLYLWGQRENNPNIGNGISISSHFEAKTGKLFSLEPLKHNKVYDTNRGECLFGIPSSLNGTSRYKFSLDKIAKNYVSRSLGLSSIFLDYQNDVYKDITISGKASLIIKSHIDDFSIGRVAGASTKRRVIPLEMFHKENTSSWQRYGFRTSSTYYVEKKTLRMSVSKPSLPYFATKDVLFPIATGHDNDSYDISLRFTDLGEFGDSFSYDIPVSFYSSNFGPCGSSQYCVVIGEDL